MARKTRNRTGSLSQGNHNSLGQPSRRLQRGCLGEIDGRSTTGRYLRRLEREFGEFVGGAPNVAQRELIKLLVETRLEIDARKAKRAAGELTDSDAADTRLIDRYRRLLRELGKPAAAKPMDAVEYGRLLDARRESEAAA